MDSRIGCDLVREVCSDVVWHDKAMRREDCLYVIGLAMSLSLYEEAKLLVDKAHTWYEYSRTLNRMSDELEQVASAEKTGGEREPEAMLESAEK